jgi:hypothetical protein
MTNTQQSERGTGKKLIFSLFFDTILYCELFIDNFFLKSNRIHSYCLVYINR